MWQDVSRKKFGCSRPPTASGRRLARWYSSSSASSPSSGRSNQCHRRHMDRLVVARMYWHTGVDRATRLARFPVPLCTVQLGLWRSCAPEVHFCFVFGPCTITWWREGRAPRRRVCIGIGGCARAEHSVMYLMVAPCELRCDVTLNSHLHRVYFDRRGCIWLQMSRVPLVSGISLQDFGIAFAFRSAFGLFFRGARRHPEILTHKNKTVASAPRHMSVSGQLQDGLAPAVR